MSLSRLRNTMEWALLVALVFGGGAIARAQNDDAVSDAAVSDDEPTGKIVKIAPTDEGVIQFDVDAVQTDAMKPDVEPELPKHWIGVLGGPVGDAVRAQVAIPEGQGVLVRRVVPDSPAAKAGLKNFDILLRANDTDLTDVRELTELVKSEGDSGGKITLDVLRAGKHESVTITPETRPEQAADYDPNSVPDIGGGFGSGGPMPGRPEDMLRFFEQRLGRQMDSRNFGRGSGFVGPPAPPTGLNAMPSGVSVNIQKRGDEPTRITVQKGNDTWDIVGDDPGSLEQLPEDVRPFVEQLLHSGGSMPFEMPGLPHMPAMPQHGPSSFNDDALQQRLHRMEQEMQRMRLMIEHEMQTPQANEPSDKDTE